MSHLLKIGVAVTAMAALAASALAGSVVGVWHGHIKIDSTHVAGGVNTDHRNRMNKAQQSAFSLTLKPDHTFQIVWPGAPSRSGTWSQTATSVTMQETKDGKNMGTPEVFTIGKNGSTLAMGQRNPANGLSVVVTFSR